MLLWFVTGAVIVGAVVRSKTFQHWATQQVASYFSEELNTKVSIGGFDINHLTYLNINAIFIGDRYNDTAFFIGKMTIDLERLVWDFEGEKANHLAINYVKLKNTLVNFKKYNDTAQWNYQFVVDYFDPPRDPNDTTAPRSFILKVNKVDIENTTFAYTHYTATDMGKGKFNPNDFRFNNITGSLSKFSLFDDSIAFSTDNLTTIEKNGFLIKKMKADAHIHAKGLEFFNLTVETEKSTLHDKLRMIYNGWEDLGSFVSTVKFDARLTNSKVNLEDIVFWTPTLQNLKQELSISGLAKGTIDNLKVKKFTIGGGKESHLSGDFSIKGLPDFETSFISVSLDKSHIITSDIKAITGLKKLPAGIARMGKIDFTGSFTGFTKSFVAYGNFNTHLGSFSSDIKLDFMNESGEASYSGYLKSEGFNIGLFINEPTLLGNVALNAKVEGKGISLKTIDATIQGKINTIDFNNYTYTNIEVDGNYAGKLFNGEAKIRDENINLDFDGSIDFTNELPKLNFVSTIHKANLDKLRIDSVISGITGKLYFNFEGDKLDNLDGVLSVSNIKYRRKTRLLRVDTAWLQAHSSDSISHLKFISSIVDFDISGQYNFSKLGGALYNYAANLLPQIVKKDSSLIAKENFAFMINVKRPYLLTNFLLKELTVDPFAAKGSINTYTNNILLDVETDQLLYNDMVFSKVAIKTNTTISGAQKLELKCGEFYKGDSLYLEDGVAALTFDSSNVFFDIILPKTIANLSTHLRSKLLFTDTLYRLVFEKSSVTSGKRKWNISDRSFISYRPKTEKVIVKDFKIYSFNEALVINGAISKDIKDTLRVDFDNFNIADINYFTRPSKNQQLGGILDGNVVLFNLFNTPLFTSNLQANKLSFGTDTLGNLNLQAHSENLNEKILIHGAFKNGLLEGSKISGWVNFSKQVKQNFGINFNLKNATTRFFEPFLAGVVSGMQGTFSTTINIAGAFGKPKITGSAEFKQPKFTIDYLQTTYSADKIRVSINDNYIRIAPFILSDQIGVPSRAGGYIRHNSFSDFEIDFRVQDMNRFLVLNTTANDNSLYFGTSYITGDFEISGPFDDLFMKIKGRTEKGTVFNLQLADESGVSKYDFITFVNHSEEPDVKQPVDLSGIRLNLDLIVTPNAEIKIIFDSQLGDIIEGTGYANLRMEINTLGDFKMFGNFEIEKGKYLFTALDFINKNFVIKKGGTIAWTGDPLNARIDITAAYPTRTSTQPLVMGLVTENQLDNYTTPIPVEALMKLKGALLKPEIKFGITIPDLTLLRGSDANTSVLLNAIRRIERDQEEVSRQVFSLLSLGTFTTPIDNGFVSTGADGSSVSNSGFDAASSTVGNLLGNQITNWLSKYDPKWDIGVQVGQGGALSRTEVIVSASRRWLNDRLQLDVSADNTSQGNINVNYKITPNGDNQVRVFGRNTNNPIYNKNILSFGGGFYFRKEFETFDELRRSLFIKRISAKDTGIVPIDSIPSSIIIK